MKPVRLAPSILSADFARLGEQIREAEAGGADWIHVDVMDGHFVPNLTIGPLIAKAARSVTDLPLDAHLMVSRPEQWVDAFADAGVQTITVHVEAAPHLHRVVQQIRDRGVRAGVSLNPATPVSSIEEVVPYVDLVLVMSVNPGFGGQSYVPTSTEKIRRVRALIDERGNGDVDLEVDGGVGADNVAEVVAAGADVVVAGSAVYNAKASVAENLARLREAAEGARRG